VEGDEQKTRGARLHQPLTVSVATPVVAGFEVSIDGRFSGVHRGAWGTDLAMTNGRWSNARARGYRRGAGVRDPFQLRLNAYRVLLTRGRDACVVFVPALPELDDTFDYLSRAGFKRL
jgi:hypothetical protein